MDTSNHRNIITRINTLTECLNNLIGCTLDREQIYIITERMKILKLTQTQYHSMLFEQDLFDMLIKNKYAISMKDNDNLINDETRYANIDYPFPLVICSKQANRGCIQVNNVGIVLIKFILYLRMLNQNSAIPDGQNCFVACNMRPLPFGRVCIDIDYKRDEDDSDDDNYKRFVEQCFHIVVKHTSMGDILMTSNCRTYKTRSFHLITEQQFDAVTKQIIFLKIAENIQAINNHIKIDHVDTWMLPYGRGHVPVRRYNRKSNEFVMLEYPYTEIDFELAMPFDLSMGSDNMYTLFNVALNDEEIIDDGKYGVLHEFNDEFSTVQNYHITCTAYNNIAENLQPLMRILSLRYNFLFRNNQKYHYSHDYLMRVFNHKYNSFFAVVSNKTLLFQNNWQVPKVKTRKRPSEPYDIYRYISPKFLNGIVELEDMFKMMPDTLVSKNVNIGNVEQTQNEELKRRTARMTKLCVKRQYTEELNDFEMHNVNLAADNLIWNILPSDEISHPWPYVVDGFAQITKRATSNTKNCYQYFHKTLPDNVYPFEKIDGIYDGFKNIQSMLSYDKLLTYINTLMEHFMRKEDEMQTLFLLPMYEFFCRVHYIDACLNYSEFTELITMYPIEILRIDETIEAYRSKYLEMTPGHKVYDPFPYPKTPLSNIWPYIQPIVKILLHTIYMMVVEHNYTSVFFSLLNLRKSNELQWLSSLILNILDQSTPEGETKYASKEFLNFIYLTFIDGGANFECNINNLHIEFDLKKIEGYISDTKKIFVGSPMWFFLGNYHYVNEHMKYMKRFQLFLEIFKTDASQIDYAELDKHEMLQSTVKQQKTMKIFNSEPYFKFFNISCLHQQKLFSIFCRNILCVRNAENGKYFYDEITNNIFNISIPSIVNIDKIFDPVKYSTIYRLQYGIYNAWTMQMERCSNVLYTQIAINNEEFAAYPHLFNVYDEDIYRVLVNRYLKSILFTRVLNYQKNLGLLLAPIYDPNGDATLRTLNYCIDSVQINIPDLSSTDFILPDETLVSILRCNNTLYKTFKWVYCIICHYSEMFSCVITTPSSFIPKNMILDNNGDDILNYNEMLNDRTPPGQNTQNTSEKMIQRIHKMLASKKDQQRENITNELQKLSKRELTSMIVLFDSTFNSILPTNNTDENEQSPSPSTSSPSTTVSNELLINEIHQYNLSMDGQNNNNDNMFNFFEGDNFAENTKNKLLMDLFNRPISRDILQMSMEEFEKIIENNYSQHIVKFVISILSWFIRTLHTHPFSGTIFFKHIQQNRQLLYDELANLLFRHNGYFIYNNRITDITALFSCYCRNVEIVIDPVFEMSMPVDKNLYLNYDAALEICIPKDIINDIEDGCISAIYQGQFIEDSNVDLNRLWARVTIPRNKHRISPLFTLHTATGKSEYLNERCTRHFHNGKQPNYFDSSSLKTVDARGTDMAPELNANLIVCIEEFTELKEKFKLICGHSILSYKHLYADSKVPYHNNATVILATNNDPKCNEEAVIARLHVYPRRIQYASVNKYLKFQRNTVCADTTDLMTNNIMTVQLIMENMPRTMAENYRGNYMMTWMLKRFFIYNIIDPVSVNASETLQNHNRTFFNMINAQELVINQLEVDTTTSISLLQFRKLINRICEENRTLFNTKIDTYNIFTILSDKLKNLINVEAKTIRVTEKH